VSDREALAREIHVWCASIAAHAAEEERFWGFLDRGERTRAERFRFDGDRTNFVIAHGFLRATLGRYVRRPPETLAFVTGAWGKPALTQSAGDGVTFNLSHSGDYVLVALAMGRAVGVDVERWNPTLAYERLAAICFSAAERVELGTVPPQARERAFHDGWTRKEAYIKALGVGVGNGLDYFDVSLDPTTPARIIDDRRVPNDPRDWRLADVPMGSGYSAAVCAEGSDWSVRRFDAVLHDVAATA